MMSTKKPQNEIQRMFKAFGYSWHGLKFALKQPAFRSELILAVILIPLALMLTDNGMERAMLIGSVLFVLIVELLNTGVERAIDRVSLEWHEFSKQAKDVCSAAVLLSLINVAMVWLFILVL